MSQTCWSAERRVVIIDENNDDNNNNTVPGRTRSRRSVVRNAIARVDSTRCQQKQSDSLVNGARRGLDSRGRWTSRRINHEDGDRPAARPYPLHLTERGHEEDGVVDAAIIRVVSSRRATWGISDQSARVD